MLDKLAFLENVYLHMKWSEVIGQDEIKAQLDRLIISNRVPHAQLFTGNPGYGGLPLAIEFALSILNDNNNMLLSRKLGKKCQNPDLHFIFPVVKKGNERNAFSEDYLTEWFSFLDENPYGTYNEWFETLEIGNKQGVIGVAQIEKLHQKMFLKAFGGKMKICIVWGAEKMNLQASNTFLKLLEEPPKKTYFILISEDEQLLLPTIMSRCQLLEIKPIEPNVLIQKIPDNTKNMRQLVSAACGDYNKLQKLIKGNESKNYESILISGLRKAFKAKQDKRMIGDLIDWCSDIYVLGREDQKAFLGFCIQFFRDAFFINYSLNEIIHFESQNNFDITKFAPYVNSNNIIKIISLFEETRYNISRNGNEKMLFTNLALKLTKFINLPAN